MTRSEDDLPWLGLLAALVLAAAAGAARADEAPSLDASLRLWAAPEGACLREDSPFAPGAHRAGLGDERGRSEAVLRLRRGALTAELSARGTARRGGETSAEAVATELYLAPDLAGQHPTLGKKVTGWDVGYGFRPLDVVQQERRLAFAPFALEGIPQLGWEAFGERWALAALWANPLQGRAGQPRHDESGAARLFARLGPLDLHAVARWSERTRLQAGAGGALVVGEALELHGSARWQARGEHLAMPSPGAGGSPLASAPPGPAEVRHGEVAALLGFTLAPGWDLSLVGEAWLDPEGDSPGRWRTRRALAEAQRALLGASGVPAAAVEGNLAWGLSAFDRPNLLRQNLLLHASRKWGRLEPALDLLVTPEDRGLVATATAAYQGERLRVEGGVRLFGGPPGAAYRLFPESAMFYAAGGLFL